MSLLEASVGRYTFDMATATHNPEPSKHEPLTRMVTRELPNLRNPIVAAEYRRQRAVIRAGVESQREELDFWEATQTHEGWD
jgi:hypothetical protein